MIQIPRKVLSSKRIIHGRRLRQTDQQPAVRPECGGHKNEDVFISSAQRVRCALVHYVFRRSIRKRARFGFYTVPRRPSVAGLGVAGPCGPRTGNSSGVLPGNSSGGAGSPGSCTGGGTSGRGLPGGSSRGGSVGVAGVAGGISGGSIGIMCIANHVAPSGSSWFRQR